MKKEYPDILKLEGEKWHNPDPATGKLGTRVPAEWLQTTEDSLKSLTLEMLEVLKAAGINPNELNNTQVRDAIQKMILTRVINYNDIQGRPVVKDSLGDDRNNPASQRVVNDVNRDVVTAQKTANTANEKANAAQTTANQAKNTAATADSKATSAQSKADSAYNLANSKQDKLEFTNKNNFSAKEGDVVKFGFAGLGRAGLKIGTYNWISPSGINGFQYESAGETPGRPPGSSASFAINLVADGVDYALQIGSGLSQDKLFFRHKHNGVWRIWKSLLNELDITSSDGQSKSLIASQYLVSSKQSLNKKIKDVTSIRNFGTTYTNTTKDVIEVYVKSGGDRTSNIHAYINDSEILYNSFAGENGPIGIYFTVYPGETYRVKTSGTSGHDTLIYWRERAI